MQQGAGTSLLTTGEVAQRLGISRHTLLRAVERGEITPSLRTPGGYPRFLPDTVEAYAHRLSPPTRRVPRMHMRSTGALEHRSSNQAP
jgi:excisionase family DNA binding protein